MRILPLTLLLFSCSDVPDTETDRASRLEREQMHREDDSSPPEDNNEKPEDSGPVAGSADDREDQHPGDDEDDDQDDGDDPADTEEPEDNEEPGDPVDDRFWPVEGDWNIYELSFALDECGLGELVTGGIDTEATLNLTSGRRFNMTHHFGNDDCELDVTGATYTCRSRVIVDTTARDEFGIDANILLDLTISGSFMDQETMVLRADVEADCEGPYCDVVEFAAGTRFPCDILLDLDASAD